MALDLGHAIGSLSWGCGLHTSHVPAHVNIYVGRSGLLLTSWAICSLSDNTFIFYLDDSDHFHPPTLLLSNYYQCSNDFTCLIQCYLILFIFSFSDTCPNIHWTFLTWYEWVSPKPSLLMQPLGMLLGWCWAEMLWEVASARIKPKCMQIHEGNDNTVGQSECEVVGVTAHCPIPLTGGGACDLKLEPIVWRL